MIKIISKITEPALVLPCGLGELDQWRHVPATLDKIMTQLNELAATLITVDNQLTKAKGEIIAKLDELSAALADTALSPEAEEALASLTAQAQALDDIVPDVEPVEPVVEG